MKIVYYGNFKNPFSTETYISDALERQGVKVVRLNKYDQPFSKLKGECADADYLLVAKMNTPLPQVDCPVICWVFDLFFDLPEPFDRPFNKQFHFKADKVFSTDGGHDEEWEKHKVDHTCIRQGVDQKGKYVLEPNYKYDTAFIGSISYPYRSKLVNFIKRNKGLLVQEGYYADNLNRLLSEVKIVVGDSVPSPKYWSNRVYEITGRGGFIIHPYVEGIKDEFPDLVTYTHGDLDELKDKVDYYLKHDNERKEIKRKCHEVCPTYDDRVKEFLCTLQKQ